MGLGRAHLKLLVAAYNNLEKIFVVYKFRGFPKFVKIKGYTVVETARFLCIVIAPLTGQYAEKYFVVYKFRGFPKFAKIKGYTVVETVMFLCIFIAPLTGWPTSVCRENFRGV